MEQTQAISTLPDMGWLTTKCRSLVIATLIQMDNACLELFESGHKTVLGDPASDIVGQMHIYDASVFVDFVKGGSVGAAEAYLSQKWNTPDLTTLIRVFARNQQTLDAIEQSSGVFNKLKHKLLSLRNANTQAGSKKNILAHYDLGNELYSRFLDDKMIYSCALYSQDKMNLSQAQTAKLKAVCDKLSLTSSDHLIEIGTGWGGLAIYAATHYGCQVTTTTISDAQYNYAQQRVKALGLSGKITLLKQDYRLLTGRYDKLVSIEMIEAVGHEFMSYFFTKCSDLLKADGKMLIQAITIADQRYDTYRKSIDFINKYIFPGGCLPSIAIIGNHIAKSTDMMIDNIEDIGLHYARTLSDWRDNFDLNWSEIQSFGYDEKFKRLWHYYLGYCEGAFIEGVISTHHIVAKKPTTKRLYRAL